MIQAKRAGERLVRLPRSRKRVIMLASDTLFVPAALWSALALKLEGLPDGLGASPWLYVAALLTSIPIFVRLGLYRAVVRFIGAQAIVAVTAGVTASVVVLAVINAVLPGDGVPAKALLIYWALALVYVGGTRILARNLMNIRPAGAERVVVYGAGAAGAQAVAALRSGTAYDPVAFLDDDPALHRSVVTGIDVYSPGTLPMLIEEESVRVVLLALPSQTRRRRQEILKSLEPYPVRVMTVPDIADIVAGSARVEDVRDVDASDLLGRDSVPPDERLFDACIRDKIVMVTGAGGSIGSELCRQIARLAPRRVVLFEMSELALYQVDRELRALMERERLEFELISLLGNAHHKYRVREILQAYAVQTLYHAAAYKHVPIVEQNVIEGIHNNVISTWYTAEAALECGVENFVLVSTDKAVNPTNVMGATKRLAEIVLQGLQQRGGRTQVLHGALRQRARVLGLGGAVVPGADPPRRAGHGHAPGRHPLFHDHSRGLAARAAGRGHGRGRRRVRPRHGQADPHRGPRAPHGQAGRPQRARRRSSRWRHRDPLHGPAASGEALRGAPDRQQRLRHRAPYGHACDGALAALGSGAAVAQRPARRDGAVRRPNRLRTAAAGG